MSDVAALLESTALRATRRRVGLALGYTAPDGRVTTSAAGRLHLPDGATPDAGSRFEIGSITKTFTALALARAVVDGDVTLDTPVGELVPEVAGLGRDGHPVTLGHLATHTSGLPRVHLSALRGTVDALRGIDPYRAHTEEVFLAAVAAGRLRRTPGTGRPAYSNSGFGLLGLALARRAGTPYAGLIGSTVTGPLGLTDTGTRAEASPEQTARTAVGHFRRRTPAAAWNLDALPGAGALLSTVTNQLTWARAHLDPPSGELGEAVRLALTPHGRRIGLAWQLTSTATETPVGTDHVVWHSGGTGGFRTMLCLRPDVGDALVLLSNHTRSVALLGFRLLAAIR
ncbi:serine hydrolase domain-containing protein [Isoptericola aurantiacus]|uniref:serine hydrolase domain-containing protein n=1 Tax=Isoptericola aurantiacus TaxID=3377839 RepID=UPI00383AE3B4